MLINNQSYRLKRKDEITWLDTISTCIKKHLKANQYPLRFAIVAVKKNEILIETTILQYDPQLSFSKTLNNIEILHPRRKSHQHSSFGVVQLIRTGIRCEFGGFAGDACPATNLLAATADFLVTHPNAVNASEINVRQAERQRVFWGIAFSELPDYYIQPSEGMKDIKKSV